MMGALRQWLTALVAVTLLSTVAQSLIPEGSLKRIASFTSGLLLLAALLQPVLRLNLTEVLPEWERYERTILDRQEELETLGDDELEKLIASQTNAYISDKAAALGLRVSAQVELQTNSDGTPVPVSVKLEGSHSRSLAAWMEEELGIPPERQVWYGTEE